jgi:hypothetical protein
LRNTLAERGVHDDLGVRVNYRGASGRDAELAQENTNTERRLDRQHCLMKLDDARGLSRVRWCRT